MNLTNPDNTTLPYITFPEWNFKALVDTGSTKSFIKPNLAIKFFRQNIRSEPFEIKSAHGNSKEKFSVFIPTPEIFQTPGTTKLLMFDFNSQFDCLLGIDFLQKQNLNIDLGNKTLKNNKIQIPLQFKKTTNEVHHITIPPQSEKIIQLQTEKTADKEVLIPNIHYGSGLITSSGIAKIRNNKITCSIVNPTEREHTLNLSRTVDNKILQDFEIPPPLDLNHIEGSRIHHNVIDLIRTDHLNTEEKLALEKIISEYPDIFHMEDSPLSFTNQVKHKIITTHDTPIHTKTYRYPPIHREEVRSQIQKMLDQNIIRPSYSPWTSPIWVVPKKTDASGKKKWRIVVDYRKLNEKTVADKYPLPNIDDLLDKLGRCQYFTTLDLASGFHQIEVDEESIPKTAFSSDSGHWEFLRMPFGLRNAPATFQRTMDNVLRGLINVNCLVYLDDIIIFSTSLTEHLANIRKVFNRLRQFNLKLQLDKSEFLQKEVAYLGHIITPEGIKPNPSKIRAIKKFPIPKTTKQIKSFLGLLGYYRKFIKDFAKLTKPLTKRLKKGAKININDEDYKESFELCRNLLMNDPILQYPDFNKPFILTTDASNYAIGAILSQGKVGSDLPVAYASRTLNSSETVYSTIEKELLAIVWATKYFRPYLYGRQFTIVTDHKPLQWLFNLKEPSSKLVRWRLKLEEFDYKVEYKKGILNGNADALSRVEINMNSATAGPSNQYDDETQSTAVEPREDDQDDINLDEIPLENLLDPESQIDFDNLNFDDIPDTNATVHTSAEHPIIGIPIKDGPVNVGLNQIIITEVNFSRADLSIKTIHGNKQRIFVQFSQTNWENQIKDFIDAFITPKVPYHLYFQKSPFEQLYERFSRILQKYFPNSGYTLVKCTQYLSDIENPDDQKDIVKSIHEGVSNHRGIDEVEKIVRKTYYWPNIRKTVQEYINNCEPCQLSKYDRHPLKLKFNLTPTPIKPFQILHIDSVSLEGTKFLSIIDAFSKYAQIYPLESAQAIVVANKLIQYFSHHGIPQTIISDNGGEFKNAVIKELLALHKVELHFISSQHPESNGMVERFHSTLIEHIRLFNNQQTYKGDDIRTKVIYAVLAYNNTIHSVTNMKPINIINGHVENTDPFNLDLDRQILTSYIHDHKERTKLMYRSINEKLQANKEKIIEKVNKSREDLPNIPPTVLVANKQKQSKTKNKYKKETIATVDKEMKTAHIKPTHQNTTQKIHLSNIKRPITRSYSKTPNVSDSSAAPPPTAETQ